jgi:hypothetical protein
MKNNTIEYLSLLDTMMENEASDIESELAKFDDGEGRSVEEAKSHLTQTLDAMIIKLNDFKKDIEKLPLKKLQEKYW